MSLMQAKIFLGLLNLLTSQASLCATVIISFVNILWRYLYHGPKIV